MESACCSQKSKDQNKTLGENIILYQPLIVIGLISMLGASALALTGKVPFMNGFMGLFLCFLAALKFFNLSGFTSSFAGYDLLAVRFRLYGLSYPFIELGLALLYLSGTLPLLTNILMIVVMLIGSTGVIKTIRSGTVVQCGCVGAGFNLPVGRVTLFENMMMAAMAAINLMMLS